MNVRKGAVTRGEKIFIRNLNEVPRASLPPLPFCDCVYFVSESASEDFFSGKKMIAIWCW